MLDVTGKRFVAIFSHNGKLSHRYIALTQGSKSKLLQSELKQRSGVLIGVDE